MDFLDAPNDLGFTPNEEQCGLYRHHNQTKYDFTGGKYGMIPFTLILNSVGWVVLILLFAILRKIAWDYGRIALVSRSEENSTLRDQDQGYNVWTSLFYGEHDKAAAGSQESLDTHLHTQDKGFCTWIPAFIRVKDSDIIQKCGHDAIQFLSFQRYLIVYTTIITILSVAVVIPVNFSGTNIGNATDFGHTTIGNLSPKSPLLWIHALLAVAFLFIIVFMMHHFSRNLDYQTDEQVSRTLMISNVAPNKCYKNVMTTHFQEAYPETVVVDVQFAYNISKLVILDKKRRDAADARQNSVLEFERTNMRPMMRPYLCGRCFCCCDSCGCKQVDAIDFYTELESKMKNECEVEKVTAYKDPQGMAFVSFQTDLMAERVHADFSTTCKGAHNCPPSSVYHDLHVNDWEVSYAPSPENINWENLTKHGLMWWVRAVIINCFVVILLFFFTSPLIIINNLDKIHFNEKAYDISPFVESFLPTLLLWIFSALLPNIVYYSDQFIGHWTRSSEHHSVMIKVFIFLILMVLVLPSLGLTSANALFEWFIKDEDKKLRWQCVFLAGNGAFFVNYIITAAFIGTALELMRFSELIVYGIRLFFAKSSAEVTAIRKSTVWEFQYGIQYAWMLCVFAVIICYSLPCPLIAPFGLVYMGLKHVVDRYNIYFAYKASRINKDIHTSAISFVVAAVILLQANVTFFAAVRSEGVSPVFVFSSIALFISMLGFIGRVCFGWFKQISSLSYKKASTSDELNSEEQPFGESDNLTSAAAGNGATPFVASVLLEEEREAKAPANNTINSSYGALDSGNQYNIQSDE